MSANVKSWRQQALDIARAVLGERLTDEELMSVLLNETGYPCYFHGYWPKELRRQLEEYRDFGPLVDIETGERQCAATTLATLPLAGMEE